MSRASLARSADHPIQWVILDRDGVINQDRPDHVRSPEQWLPLPGSLEAIARLNRAHMPVVVASNQSGIARGWLTESTLHAIHATMQQALTHHRAHLDGIWWCPHAPLSGCDCRKPQPGLLLAASRALKRPLQYAIMVGDAVRDIQAGQAAGAHTLLVRTGQGQAAYHDPTLPPTACCQNLDEAVSWILQRSK